MKSRNVLFRPSILILLALTALLASCSYDPKPYKLGEREKIYDTQGEALSIFHRVAEKDGGLSLKFPGYLIGVERAYRDNIGWHKNLEIINEEKFHDNDKYRKNVRKILSDWRWYRPFHRKRAFVSHIVEYRLDPNKGYVEEDFVYNAYDKCFSPEKAYLKGLEALNALRERIFRDKTPYTHIFLYSMGWNTDQQESLRNYNSLVSLMIKAAKGEKPFKPLFIGISWPSEWRSRFFIKKYLSYGPKANDADEVGILWVNRILWNILVPLKKDRNIPLIVIGHSFGARIVTRAVFSNGLINESTPTEASQESDIDLVIGLQGAFDIDRFIPEEGKEGSPYSKFYDKDKYTKKFIFTWSEYDTANPTAKFFTGSSHIGGYYGYKQSLKFPGLFKQFTIDAKDDDNSYDVDYRGIMEKEKWKQSFSHPEKISIVNATKLMRHKPYDKGGNAHSDIYTPGIARFIWDCIDNLKQSNGN